MDHIQIAVLYQDKDFLAVSKPAGISVHNNEDPQNLLLLLQKQIAVAKLYPVHRLDKETSGIQLLALHEVSARKLAEEFEKRSVNKIYAGVLRGELKESKGIWNQALTDKAEGRKNPAGMSRDRIACETQFEVLKKNKFFSYCHFKLITGRQHQIRKHSALVNHSLVGDPRYGDPRYNKKMADLYKTDRMFLHCYQIQILGHSFECLIPDHFKKIVT